MTKARPIKPRQAKVKGCDCWYVHVPAAVRPHFNFKTRSFRNEADARAFSGEITKYQTSLVGITAVHNAIRRLVQDPFFKQVVDINDTEQAKKAEAEASKLTISEAAEAVLASKRESGVRKNSLASLSCSLASFADYCKEPLAAVRPATLDAWIASHPTWTPKTKRGRLVDVSTMFSWHLKRGNVAKNPVAAVEMPRVPYKAAEILAVDDVEKLLRTCETQDPALIGWMALILFGGLRAQEAARTKPENVHDGIVDIGGASTKLNVRRCFAVQPVLAAWLAAPGAEIGGEKIYPRFRAIRKASGVHVSPNALRHTAASAWLALLGADNAAKMLGHSTAVLYRNYASKMTIEDAKQFEAIRPTPTSSENKTL